MQVVGERRASGGRRWTTRQRCPRAVATDDPLHGAQEGRFFHGYYKSDCYLPLYIFSGEHLLRANQLRLHFAAIAEALRAKRARAPCT